jgi:hypothetical protein
MTFPLKAVYGLTFCQQFHRTDAGSYSLDFCQQIHSADDFPSEGSLQSEFLSAISQDRCRQFTVWISVSKFTGPMTFLLKAVYSPDFCQQWVQSSQPMIHLLITTDMTLPLTIGT